MRIANHKMLSLAWTTKHLGLIVWVVAGSIVAGSIMAGEVDDDQSHLLTEILQNQCHWKNLSILDWQRVFYIGFLKDYNIKASEDSEGIWLSSAILGRNVTITRCPTTCNSLPVKNTFWCIKLLTNTHDVKICLSNTGVISQTEVARRAGLSDHFEVGPDDAVKISNVPKVLNGALLSCFVKTPSCQDVAHTTFVVKDLESPMTTAILPPRVVHVQAGENASITCSFHGRDNVNAVGWKRSGCDSFIRAAGSNQWCPLPSGLTASSYPSAEGDCPTVTVSQNSDLMIGNATGEHEGVYSCVGSYSHGSSTVIYSYTTRIIVYDKGQSPPTDPEIVPPVWTITCVIKTYFSTATGKWVFGGDPVPVSVATPSPPTHDQPAAIVIQSGPNQQGIVSKLELTLYGYNMPYQKAKEFTCLT